MNWNIQSNYLGNECNRKFRQVQNCWTVKESHKPNFWDVLRFETVRSQNWWKATSKLAQNGTDLANFIDVYRQQKFSNLFLLISVFTSNKVWHHFEKVGFIVLHVSKNHSYKSKFPWEIFITGWSDLKAIVIVLNVHDGRRANGN